MYMYIQIMMTVVLKNLMLKIYNFKKDLLEGDNA